MKKNLTFILPALCLLLAGMVIYTLFIRKDENYGEGFDGKNGASTVYDQAGIFNGDKETLQELNILVDEYSDKLDMNIVVYINDRRFYSDSQVQLFCDDLYDNEYGEYTDGIFYLIDISGSTPARDCISTSGKAVLLYQKNLDRIFSSMDAYLPSSGSTVYPDDIDGAVREFFDQIEHYGRRKPGIFESYHDKVRGFYYYYRNGEFIVSKNRPPSFDLIILLISAVVGIITGIISYSSIKSKYRFKGGTNSSVYVAHGENNLTESSDIFIRSYVTKRKIETSSSGGGGRSGGGGGHSGSHGGGVHHR